MKLIRNLAYLSGAEFASKVVTFSAIAYLARILGPTNFGYIEFAGSVMLCAGLLVDQGFGPYGAREIARAPARTGELFTEIVLVRLVLALLAYAAVACFALIIDRSALVTRLLFLYGLSLLGMPLLLQWVFQGHDQMRTAAAINLIRQATYAVVVFAFVRTPEQIWVVAMAEVAGVVLAALFGLWQYQSRFEMAKWAQVKISQRLFREGVPIGLSQLFWMVRMYGATVVLGLIASPQDVGFFGAAMRILVALHAFIYLYYFNLLPSLSRAWQQSNNRLGTIIANSLHRVIWVCLIVGLSWVLLAPTAITAAYGAAFGPAGETLKVLAGVGIAALISGHYRFGLIAAGRQKAEMVCQVLGSSIALVLIPFGYARNGPAGAAAALVIAEVAVWFTSWFWANKLGLEGHAGLYLRPVAALAAVLGLIFLLPSTPITQASVATIAIVIMAIVLDETVRNDARQFGLAAVRWLWERWTRRAAEGAR